MSDDDTCTTVRPIPGNLLIKTKLLREAYPRIDLALCLDVGAGARIIATLPSGADLQPLAEGPAEESLKGWLFYVFNTDRGTRPSDFHSYWETLQEELDRMLFEGVPVLLCSEDISYGKLQ